MNSGGQKNSNEIKFLLQLLFVCDSSIKRRTVFPGSCQLFSCKNMLIPWLSILENKSFDAIETDSRHRP